MSIAWQPEYTVHDEELDQHHQQLIRYIQVLDEPDNRSRADGDFLRIVVDGLVAYASFHFAAEERRMVEAGYPGYEAHRQEHLDFAKDTLVFRDAFGQGSARLEKALLSYLTDWLRTHILTTDRAMGEFLKSKRESPAGGAR